MVTSSSDQRPPPSAVMQACPCQAVVAAQIGTTEVGGPEQVPHGPAVSPLTLSSPFG